MTASVTLLTQRALACPHAWHIFEHRHAPPLSVTSPPPVAHSGSGPRSSPRHTSPPLACGGAGGRDSPSQVKDGLEEAELAIARGVCGGRVDPISEDLISDDLMCGGRVDGRDSPSHH